MRCTVQAPLLPRELSRLDIKNWTPTPAALGARLAENVRALAAEVDAIVVMDQVSIGGTGVVTSRLLAMLGEIARVDVENRLPVSVARREGKLHFEASSGGLATAMSSLEQDNKIWVGWKN